MTFLKHMKSNYEREIQKMKEEIFSCDDLKETV